MAFEFHGSCPQTEPFITYPGAGKGLGWISYDYFYVNTKIPNAPEKIPSLMEFMVWLCNHKAKLYGDVYDVVSVSEGIGAITEPYGDTLTNHRYVVGLQRPKTPQG